MPELNPIQQNIANGMSAIAAFLTEATCGVACWEAREDVCHCSCNGKNHGCMRTADGVRPTRTAKIDGYRYELAAVDASDADAKAINHAAPKRNIGTNYSYYWDSTDKGAPARMKLATDAQLAAWPELKAYRDARSEVMARESWCWAEVPSKPYLLWVKL